MWGDAIQRAKRLRSRHRVLPATFTGTGVVCRVDGVRIHPTVVGWMHDAYEAGKVHEAASAVATPSQLR